MFYQCPLCFMPLSLHNNVWRCPNKHSFDQAREGYVNLLPVHHKHSKHPGDNPQMITARRLFLDAGFYHLLRKLLVELVLSHIPKGTGAILDIGCGEGYYTSAMANSLPEREIYGLDIAKIAIKNASSRYKQVNFCVASSHRLPFENQSMAAITKVYAPCKPEELHRVLQDKGIIVTVSPAADHLYQLKQLIYQTVQQHKPEKPLKNFKVINKSHLSYPMALTGDQAVALLQMTPFAWRASKQIWQKLMDAEQFDCQADFCLTVYQR